MSYDRLNELGISLTQFSFKLGLPIEPVIRRTVFEQFCGGETLEDCQTSIHQLADQGVRVIIDYGLEAKEREEDYDSMVQELLRILAYEKYNDDANLISIKVTALAHFALLKKVNEGLELNEKEAGQWQRVKERLYKVCDAAVKAGAGILIDAEESWIQHAIDGLADELMAKYNHERLVIYNTFQMYRKDRLDLLKTSHTKAKAEGYLLGAKPVRGAYIDKERDRAKRKGYPSPIHDTKADTDAAYNSALDHCLQYIEDIGLCVATHNEASCMHQVEQMEAKGLIKDHPHVFFAQLYGMGEGITFNLNAAGYRVAKLIPYGPIRQVIPYLIRRAQENSSVSGQMGRELTLLNKEMVRRKKA